MVLCVLALVELSTLQTHIVFKAPSSTCVHESINHPRIFLLSATLIPMEVDCASGCLLPEMFVQCAHVQMCTYS